MFYTWLRQLRQRLFGAKNRSICVNHPSFQLCPVVDILEERNSPSVNWTNPAGGDWDTASNWSTGNLPGPDDDVIIDIKLDADAVITHHQAIGDSIRSLTSSDPIQ